MEITFFSFLKFDANKMLRSQRIPNICDLRIFMFVLKITRAYILMKTSGDISIDKAINKETICKSLL